MINIIKQERTNVGEELNNNRVKIKTFIGNNNAYNLRASTLKKRLIKKMMN